MENSAGQITGSFNKGESGRDGRKEKEQGSLQIESDLRDVLANLSSLLYLDPNSELENLIIGKLE